MALSEEHSSRSPFAMFQLPSPTLSGLAADRHSLFDSAEFCLSDLTALPDFPAPPPSGDDALSSAQLVGLSLSFDPDPAFASGPKKPSVTFAVPVAPSKPKNKVTRNYRAEVERQRLRERKRKRDAAQSRISEREREAAEEVKLCAQFADVVPFGKRRAIQGKVPNHLRGCNPTVINLARGKISQKSVMSCHQCKSRKNVKELSFCATHPNGISARNNRMCRKKYCTVCLDRFYDLDPPEIAEWFCPGCLGKCVCSACRKDSAKQQPSVESEKMSVDSKKPVKKFPLLSLAHNRDLAPPKRIPDTSEFAATKLLSASIGNLPIPSPPPSHELFHPVDFSWTFTH